MMAQNKTAQPVARKRKKKEKAGPKEEISEIKAGKRQLADIKKEIKRICSEQRATAKKKNQFLKEIKGFEIKLDFVLEKETIIEKEIEEIEKTEKITSLKNKKEIEKKRWKMENKRRRAEKEKWGIQKKIKEAKTKIKSAELKEQNLLKAKERLEEKRERNSQKLEELARKRIQFLKRFLGEKPLQFIQVQNAEQRKQAEEMKKAEELKRLGDQERQKHFEEIKMIEGVKAKQEESNKAKTQLLLPPKKELTEKKEVEKITSPIIKIESQSVELAEKAEPMGKTLIPAKLDDSYKIKERAIKEQEKIRAEKEKTEAGKTVERTEKIKELEKKRQEELKIKQEEEKIVKEKYVPYVPKQKEFVRQLEKEQEEIKRRHKQELERQAKEIRQRQVEEFKKQDQEWKKKQEELRREKEENIASFKERIRKKKEDLEAKRKMIEEEVEKIRQEEMIREELRRKREEPIPEEEIQLSKEKMEERKKELELRRKAIEEEARRLQLEELEREKAEREKEEQERKKKAATPAEEEKLEIKTAKKEKQLTEEEIKERRRKEKELIPLFKQAVRHYKAKEFDKANELLLSLEKQVFEPEKEPEFFDKLFDKVPLYIKIEDYLKKIKKQKKIISEKEAKLRKKEKKKEVLKKEEPEEKPLNKNVFNIFGRIKPAHPTIGIDISDHSIEILYLNRQKSIMDYGRTTIRGGIIRDGEIIKQKELTEAFRLTCQQAGLKPFDPRKGLLSKAIVSLPESKTYIQVFAFDSRNNLLKKIKEKMESAIPFPISDLYWSYAESWDQNTGKTKVLCAAALKDIVDSQAHFLRSSGINPIAFDIESASMGRALIPEREKQEATAILDIGARTSNLSIFDKKAFLSFSLTIRCAGLDFVKKISDHLAIPQEKAENIMKEKGFKKEDNPFLPVLEEEMGKIIKETQKSIDYYQTESGENAEKIILAGGMSLLPGISDFFQERFEKTKVVAGNPFEKIKRKGGLKEETAVLYANVIGLALRAVSKNPVKDGINLSPEEIKSREK